MAKKNQKTRIAAFLLAFTLVILQIPVTARGASPRPADVEKAGSGNLLVGVSGSFERVSKDTILKRINEIRKEACKKGYINPATGKKLKSSDYVEMKWSSDLEWIAQLRAAEAAVNEDHTRPNGKICFSISHNGTTSYAENLAWNYSGLMQGIEQWYGEKGDWVKQNKNKVTGHYTSMINPNYQYIGLGSFVRSAGGWHAVSAEFGYSASGSQKQSGVKGKTIQTIEVRQKNIKQPKLNASSSIKKNQKKQLTVTGNVVYPGIMGGTNTTKKAEIIKGITWKSSKPSVLSVNSSGKITAKKTGKATISAKIKGGKTLKKTITVKK